MKRQILFFILLAVFNSNIVAQIKVEVVVISNSLNPDENIFIAGNKPELGNWNPSQISLNKINDSTFSKEFECNKDEYLEFKFTKGDWNKEALDENGYVPDNIRLKVTKDTTICIRVLQWKDSYKDIVKKITGKVEYFYDFKGDNILPRNIVVWLPPSYDSLSKKRYPVLYMNDGQNLFDASTSFLGSEWCLDETADSLIKSGAIKEIIIVGIYNTMFRASEYTDNDTGYAYQKFITNRLKLFIDSTYRTLSDKRNSVIGGSSGGGLVSFMIAWKYPKLFANCACLSPAFKIQNIDFVKNVNEYCGPKKQIKIYIDNGSKGVDSLLQSGVSEMLKVLNEKGYKEGEDIYWFKDEKAEHNENAWAKRSWRFLEYFFSKQ